MIRSTSLVAFFSFLPTLLCSEEANWNQFRGPTADGWSTAKNLPIELADAKNIVWKKEIAGKGWSSPVVWNDQVWVTTADPDGHNMYAVCVDFNTGKLIHNLKVFENEEPQYCHSLNSYATPTPFIEQGRLYVHFGIHGTACIDTKTGEKIWQRRDMECNHHRGPAASPIIVGDNLVVHFDGFDQQYVIAFNKDTGKTAWKHTRAFDYGTDNGDRKKAYGTPTLIEVEGVAQLIAPAAVATEALDPKTGKVLWTAYYGGMNVSSRPIYKNGLLYLANGMGRLAAVDPQGKGDITDKIQWSTTKGAPKKASVLIIDELLYSISDQGVLTCMNASTGKTVWSQRLGGGEYAASPIYADGRIYVFSMEGKITVIKPGDEYEEIATSEFPEGFMASPAVKGASIILRSKQALYRIEKKS